ncbi:MAG: MmgE/PrpD family protein, partial [Candidatus Competibacteraceae bacterium]|nr:MmgE/PrpD family protein [Candidatus Competibacteraceae bacterium]
SGSRTDMSRIMRDHVAAQFGAGSRSAQMLFDGRAVSAAGAALAGGVSIDALDAHDGHRLVKGHVGCGVFPAALALSEAEDRLDGAEFLTALVLGYEIGTRAGMALHRSASDYHTSGAWVALATAALGARALALDTATTREALGIAEYHGPRSPMMRVIDHPTMVKDGSGWGAMAGVSAAYLAASGFTGAPALTVERDDLADLWSDLGEKWRIFEQYFKPYPICRWAQPPVQAILQLRREHNLQADQVERIEVHTFHQAVRLAIRRPETTEQAQYSTAFPCATALVRGVVGADEVAPQAFNDPAILRLADSMLFTESDDFNAAFPARRFAQVTLQLKDGRRLASAPTEARGDPEDPASMAEVRAKFHALATPVLGVERASAIEQAVDGLGEQGSVAELIRLAASAV